jgi:hypothetical protein
MLSFKEYLEEGKRGLWDNIHAKRNRIKHGSGERMRKPGSKGAPSAADFKAAAESFEYTFDMLEEAVNSIDKGEYDYEGQMARTQLQTILRNSKDLVDMLSDEENMPEWVQSKITLAQDYITCVRDYLQSREELEEDAKGYKNPTGGLTQKGRDHYNNKYGSHLKAPVTTPPSELKPGSKAANRRKSFCARMSGVEGPMKKPNGEPTRKALALRKWNC